MKAREFQVKLKQELERIFPGEPVEIEWDSLKFDPHVSNHKGTYGPRHDVAVGPFNHYCEMDCGVDKARGMQKHPFTLKLIRDAYPDLKRINKIWNRFSRCFLAIEVDFNGSTKHMFGSMVNASVSGSLGIIITNEKNLKKVRSVYNYLGRLGYLERLELSTLANILIYEEKEFIKLLTEFRNPGSSKN